MDLPIEWNSFYVYMSVLWMVVRLFSILNTNNKWFLWILAKIVWNSSQFNASTDLFYLLLKPVSFSLFSLCYAEERIWNASNNIEKCFGPIVVIVSIRDLDMKKILQLYLNCLLNVNKLNLRYHSLWAINSPNKINFF